MRKSFLTLLFICTLSIGFAQQNLPSDYLTKEFHIGRREAFRSIMPTNSVAIIFSYPERNFSNDVSILGVKCYFIVGVNGTFECGSFVVFGLICNMTKFVDMG